MPSPLVLPWHACRCMSTLPYMAACREVLSGRASHCETGPVRGLTLEHMYGNIDVLVGERMHDMAGKNDGAAREIRGAVIMVIGLGLMFVPLTLALLDRL